MIISPGRRYIFVHIPKTGGTSLALALEARAMKDDILIGDTPKAKRRRGRLEGVATTGRLWKHSTLADIDGLVAAADLSNFLVVTLVRNPWDRLVSYYHWLQVQTFDHPAIGIAAACDFEAFLLHPEIQASIKASPPSHYLRDASGALHDALFIRLEQLARDIAPLEAHLGFRLGDIPVENVSERRKDHRFYYSADTAELVENLCKEEISRFGYVF